MNNNDQWGGMPRPNLAKLPTVIREQLAQPVPLRPNEVRAKIVIFRKSPGLIHPNGRVYVTEYRKDANNISGSPDGIQIDSADFSGKSPLSSILLTKQDIPAVIENMLRIYRTLGATDEEINALQKRAEKPLMALRANTYFEDEGSRE